MTTISMETFFKNKKSYKKNEQTQPVNGHKTIKSKRFHYAYDDKVTEEFKINLKHSMNIHKDILAGLAD